MNEEKMELADRVCQLEVASEACERPNGLEQVLSRLEREARLTWLRIRKVLANPAWAVRRVLRGPQEGASPLTPGTPHAVSASTAPQQGLQAGDTVQVLSREEILETLDEEGRFEGMAYIPAVMDRFCGQTFTVRKRVDRFFDERTFKMLRLRNSVILDGVHCEPDPLLKSEFAGCQRTCFLFWKEGWLKKV